MYDTSTDTAAWSRCDSARLTCSTLCEVRLSARARTLHTISTLLCFNDARARERETAIRRPRDRTLRETDEIENARQYARTGVWGLMRTRCPCRSTAETDELVRPWSCALCPSASHFPMGVVPFFLFFCGCFRKCFIGSWFFPPFFFLPYIERRSCLMRRADDPTAATCSVAPSVSGLR